MPVLQEVCQYLESFAPVALAEDWDNVGLLIGRRERTVERIMTCLTITPESVQEAIRERAGLIVTHHPFPFRPIKRITNDATVGSMLLDLIQAGIAVYSPHTAFDSAAQGINQQLAEGLQLSNIRPLVAAVEDPAIGSGRWGDYSASKPLAEVTEMLKQFLSLSQLRVVGEADKPIRRVAIGCGAAGEFLYQVDRAGTDLLVLGETNFHTCLEARSQGVALLLTGHYASERFAVERLANQLRSVWQGVNVWASHDETNPFRYA